LDDLFFSVSVVVPWFPCGQYTSRCRYRFSLDFEFPFLLLLLLFPCDCSSAPETMFRRSLQSFWGASSTMLMALLELALLRPFTSRHRVGFFDRAEEKGSQREESAIQENQAPEIYFTICSTSSPSLCGLPQ